MMVICSALLSIVLRIALQCFSSSACSWNCLLKIIFSNALVNGSLLCLLYFSSGFWYRIRDL